MSAAPGSFRVSGLAELSRGLRKLGVSLDDLKGMFDDISRVATERVAMFAPHRSGRLQQSVRGSHARNKAVVSVGGLRVPYAGPINYGWPSRGIAASEFLQRAEQDLAPKLPDMVNEAVDRVLRQEGLK